MRKIFNSPKVMWQEFQNEYASWSRIIFKWPYPHAFISFSENRYWKKVLLRIITGKTEKQRTAQRGNYRR